MAFGHRNFIKTRNDGVLVGFLGWIKLEIGQNTGQAGIERVEHFWNGRGKCSSSCIELELCEE